MNGYVNKHDIRTEHSLTQSQDATLSYYAGYTEDEIEPVVHLMVDYLARPVVHEAFFKKYASKKLLKGMSIQSFHIDL